MKRKLFFYAIFLIVGLTFFVTVENVNATGCEGVETALIECGEKESGIGHILGLTINILTILIGILAVLGIVIAGIQYLTAAGNEAQIKKTKRRIFEIVIGLVAYALVAVFLQWILPGGSLNPSEIQHYEGTENPTEEKPGQSQDSGDVDVVPTRPEKHYEAKFSLEKGFELDYWLNVPENATDGMPLVVFLHGSGERGSSNAVKRLPQTQYIAKTSRPYIAVAPALKKDGSWSNSSTQKTVKSIIDKTVADYQVDKKRIYLVGFSLGAVGTWKMVNNYPDFFAAAVPISGGEGSSKAENFRHTKIYAAAGGKESGTSAKMKSFVDKINRAGGSATMTVYPGKNHSGMQNSIDYDEIFNWLLKQ